MIRVGMDAKAQALDVVLDTNVLLDIYSCHDLAQKYDELGIDLDLSHPELQYRCARARESLLLAVYLHEVSAVTYSCHEFLGLLAEKAKPTATTTVETHFTTSFVHFVQDYLLRNWVPKWPERPNTELRSNAADDHLLAIAKEHHVPLITNEGYSKAGVHDAGLRVTAKRAGVAVFTPAEYYAGKIDETEAADWFLREFCAHAPGFVSRYPNLAESLEMMLGVYRDVFSAERYVVG